jgi:hypothetical protein
MFKGLVNPRLSMRNTVPRAAAGRQLKKCVCFFFVTLCLLQPTPVVWGDYLLTLRSGLQIRASAYRTEGLVIHVWTEAGSMSLPSDVVVHIADVTSKPQAPSPAPQDENLDQPHLERTDEVRPAQKRENPRYIPKEKKTP